MIISFSFMHEKKPKIKKDFDISKKYSIDALMSRTFLYLNFKNCLYPGKISSVINQLYQGMLPYRKAFVLNDGPLVDRR